MIHFAEASAGDMHGTSGPHPVAQDPAWARSCGVTSVANESSGVCWTPAFEIHEQHGFDAILVNARYARTVPGRKMPGVALHFVHDNLCRTHKTLRMALVEQAEAEAAPGTRGPYKPRVEKDISN